MRRPSGNLFAVSGEKANLNPRLSDGVMVAQGSLEAFVMVRIHVGQPTFLSYWQEFSRTPVAVESQSTQMLYHGWTQMDTDQIFFSLVQTGANDCNLVQPDRTSASRRTSASLGTSGSHCRLMSPRTGTEGHKTGAMVTVGFRYFILVRFASVCFGLVRVNGNGRP
jgi:hypothetical protein